MTDLIKGLRAEFIPAQWDGKQTHGIKVVGKTVLVLMDDASGKTSGNVLLTDDKVEALSAGAESGVLVAVAPGAFLLNEDMTPWTGDRPEAGDRIYVAKYSGQLVRGKDGRIYRLMDYGCVGAVYDRIDVAEQSAPSKGKKRRNKPRKKGDRAHGGSKPPRTR